MYACRIGTRTGVYADHAHGGFSDDLTRTLCDRSRSLVVKIGYPRPHRAPVEALTRCDAPTSVGPRAICAVDAQARPAARPAGGG